MWPQLCICTGGGPPGGGELLSHLYDCTAGQLRSQESRNTWLGLWMQHEFLQDDYPSSYYKKKALQHKYTLVKPFKRSNRLDFLLKKHLEVQDT